MKSLPNPIFKHAVADAVLQQARAVKLLILDVDGVLTNGEIYITASGEEIKAFNTLDGHGLKMGLGKDFIQFLLSAYHACVLHPANEVHHPPPINHSRVWSALCAKPRSPIWWHEWF